VAIAEVRIDLLGGFTVSVGHARVPDDAWRLRKAKTLVKLLALAPAHQLPWERVGETLWPDRDASAVRNNLHQALRAAREALSSTGVDGREVLRLRDGIVTFADEAEVVVDVERWVAAVERARTSDDLDAYVAAARRYPGELLPEDRYEPWADAPRDALRDLHSSLLLELAQRLRERGDALAAIEVLRRLLTHHELHEPARRELMVLLADTGRRQEALAAYGTLREALRRTLEADPDPETRRLYRRLLAGSVEERAGGGGPEPLGARHGSDRRDNLPAALSSFVGRDREVDVVERLLGRTRLLTLTGVGGAGKTRLALEVARRQVPAFRHGVWLVDLAPASEPSQVPQAVAETLRLELPERAASVPAIAEQLADTRLLLLLDNCEHLITACAELVAELLRACPEVVVLTTSREALRVDGEVAWRVPSLALPDLHRLPEHTALGRQAAVQLFLERATAVEPRFELTPRNAPTVAELCVRLDGMPLALELAAARVRMLSPAQILERLGEALDVLGGGSRAGLSRQHTLTATLDWSHDLLDAPAQVAFRRLAVFAGSFALEAAEHVCGADPLDPSQVLGLLGRLVDQSLVIVQPHGNVARYRLLEIVRQYAGERLADADEHGTIEQRHRDWYRRWVEAHDPERAAAGEGPLHHYDVEHDNLRAALRTALTADPETALRLATSLWRFWLARGHFAEGRRWLEAALEADPADSELRARGLLAVAVLDMRYATGLARLERIATEIVDIHRRVADEAGLAQALHLAAVLLWTAHRTAEAVDRLDASCELARSLGADHLLAAATHTHGVIELSRGRPTVAQGLFATCVGLLADLDTPSGGFLPAISVGFSVEWDEGRRPRLTFEETLVMGHRLHHGSAAAHVRFSQAWAARAAGDLDAAIGFAEQSIAGFVAQRWEYGIAVAHNLLGNLHRAAGASGAARRHLETSLQVRARLRDRRATGVTLGSLGLLAAAEGDAAEAQRYLRRALELFVRTEDGFGEAGTLLNLGVAALRGGDLDGARSLLERVHDLRGSPGMRRTSGWVAVMLAEIADRQGDTRRAAECLARARATFEGLDERMGLDHCEQVEPLRAG
jgi:predicted ATPase/DNA-binding SARP family transcriptional activator